MKKIKVGIIGGAGYTGGELIRLLLNHPQTEIIFVNSKSYNGKLLSTVHQDLAGETDLHFSDKPQFNVDLLFLCTAHGHAEKFLKENKIPKKVKIISLAQDFRLNKHSEFGSRKFVYGLPEINRDKIQKADNIANPGCFATAIELGLLPLAEMNILSDVYATGITGSTGAGQGLSETAHFSWRENNVQAYKSLTHQHLAEISETLLSVTPKAKNISIHFVPWRGDFTRGIFITSQLKCSDTIHDIYDHFEKFYKGHPFIKISKEPIFLKQVVNTNNCFLHLEQVGDILVIHSVIDNLLKGASGQAVQNMNILFGFEESTGLKLKANYF
ncbi:MAG: N-acetyl-gamma-glutamyl-phosphate reductase [Ginsengibacter sp.]